MINLSIQFVSFCVEENVTAWFETSAKESGHNIGSAVYELINAILSSERCVIQQNALPDEVRTQAHTCGLVFASMDLCMCMCVCVCLIFTSLNFFYYSDVTYLIFLDLIGILFFSL